MWPPRINDEAARKYVALAKIEESKGGHPPRSDTDKALDREPDAPDPVSGGKHYVDAGELGKAQKLETSLSSALTSESQAYGKIIEGLIARRRRTPTKR